MQTDSFCRECGAALRPDVRFCGYCGTPVRGRDEGMGAAEGIEVGPARPRLTASDVVYLFGDSFVEKDNWRSEGLVLEFSGVKVQKKPLARVMLMAAFASLLKGGWIELPLVKLGIAMFKQDVPTVRGTSMGACPLGGLESALVAGIDRRGDWVNNVGLVISRAIGGQQGDPWHAVTIPARDHLVETGHLRRIDNPAAQGLGKLFHASYRLEPDPEMMDGSVDEIGRVHALMDEVRGTDGRRWDLVAKAVEKTLEALKPRDDDRN